MTVAISLRANKCPPPPPPMPLEVLVCVILQQAEQKSSLHLLKTGGRVLKSFHDYSETFIKSRGREDDVGGGVAEGGGDNSTELPCKVSVWERGRQRYIYGTDVSLPTCAAELSAFLLPPTAPPC